MISINTAYWKPCSTVDAVCLHPRLIFLSSANACFQGFQYPEHFWTPPLTPSSIRKLAEEFFKSESKPSQLNFVLYEFQMDWCDVGYVAYIRGYFFVRTDGDSNKSSWGRKHFIRKHLDIKPNDFKHCFKTLESAKANAAVCVHSDSICSEVFTHAMQICDSEVLYKTEYLISR